MYLDTDMLLALIKKDDWLKPFVNWKNISDPVISAASLTEFGLVVNGEYGKEKIESFLKQVREFKIKVVPATENDIYKSAELMKKI